MKSILRWFGARLKERSTYAGLAVIAGAAGFPEVGVVVGKVGLGASLILGGGLVAHNQG